MKKVLGLIALLTLWSGSAAQLMACCSDCACCWTNGSCDCSNCPYGEEIGRELERRKAAGEPYNAAALEKLSRH